MSSAHGDLAQLLSRHGGSAGHPAGDQGPVAEAVLDQPGTVVALLSEVDPAMGQRVLLVSAWDALRHLVFANRPVMLGKTRAPCPLITPRLTESRLRETCSRSFFLTGLSLPSSRRQYGVNACAALLLGIGIKHPPVIDATLSRSAFFLRRVKQQSRFLNLTIACTSDRHHEPTPSPTGVLNTLHWNSYEFASYWFNRV